MTLLSVAGALPGSASAADPKKKVAATPVFMLFTPGSMGLGLTLVPACNVGCCATPCQCACGSGAGGDSNQRVGTVNGTFAAGQLLTGLALVCARSVSQHSSNT